MGQVTLPMWAYVLLLVAFWISGSLFSPSVDAMVRVTASGLKRLWHRLRGTNVVP